MGCWMCDIEARWRFERSAFLFAFLWLRPLQDCCLLRVFLFALPRK